MAASHLLLKTSHSLALVGHLATESTFADGNRVGWFPQEAAMHAPPLAHTAPVRMQWRQACGLPPYDTGMADYAFG